MLSVVGWQEMKWGRWRKTKEKRKKDEKEQDPSGDIIVAQLIQVTILSMSVNGKKIS